MQGHLLALIDSCHNIVGASDHKVNQPQLQRGRRLGDNK